MRAVCQQQSGSTSQAPSTLHKGNKHKHSTNHSTVRSTMLFINLSGEEMGEYFLSFEGQDQGQCEMEETAAREKEMVIAESIDRMVNHVQGVALQENKQSSVATEQPKQPDVGPQLSDPQPEHEPKTKIQLQIIKNNLDFEALHGQIFVLLAEAQLIGDRKIEHGRLLVTNYRFAYFRGRTRKIDIPFGYVRDCVLDDRSSRLTIRMKFHGLWRLSILESKQMQLLSIFLQAYLKIDPEHLSNCFAFSYAAKCPTHHPHPLVVNEYARLMFDSVPWLHLIDNSEFALCGTYPEIVYIPRRISAAQVGRLGRYWQGGRFPILTYMRQSAGRVHIGLWRCAQMAVHRGDNVQMVGHYLEEMRGGADWLLVCQLGTRGSLAKGMLEESEINPKCENQFLEMEAVHSVRAAHTAMIDLFSQSKRPHLRQMLASKWYHKVLQYLQHCAHVVAQLNSHTPVLLKCETGYDHSAVVSALVQLVMTPFYRTLRGFSVLVEKQFQFMSYPFRSRLGLTQDQSEEVPVFVMLLDCVAQLLEHNQMSFQFNFKYLCKLSGLMYSTLYGTFITDSRSQCLAHSIAAETAPIWQQLITPITRNAFYSQNNSQLEVPMHYDDIRVWKEYFGGWAGVGVGDAYGFRPEAEDNMDYAGLGCAAVREENVGLRGELDRQVERIQELKRQIKEIEKQREMEKAKEKVKESQL